MICKVLRLIAVAVVLAECDKQIAVGGLYDAAPVMIARRQRSLLPEDHRGLIEPSAGVVEFRAHECGAATAGDALGVAEEDRAILREVFVDNDIEQTALAACPH